MCILKRGIALTHNAARQVTLYVTPTGGKQFPSGIKTIIPYSLNKINVIIIYLTVSISCIKQLHISAPTQLHG